LRARRRAAILSRSMSKSSAPRPSSSPFSPEFSSGAAAKYGVQDYGKRAQIDGVQWVELKRFNDDGGAMTELGRLDQGAHQQLPGFVARQVNYSTMEPLAIKAFHLHKRQTDVWYVPPSDKILLVLGDVRKGSPTEGLVTRHVLGDGNSRLVRIPPGVAHGCRNLRPATQSVIVYFVDVQFSVGDECDEGRLPWNHFGAEVWEVERG
jgi:dTDP-4-dehydrorhamnose 3,5-epimerase